MSAVSNKVLADWRTGIANYHYWWRFGAMDIRLRYRRTALGPFWVTVSFAMSAAAMTFVFSHLFNVSRQDYFAYLIAGLAVWTLISGMIVEGCSTFITQGGLLQQHSLPALACALRSVTVSFLGFLHNLVVVAVALLVFAPRVGWHTLAAIPGLVVVLLNGLWMALLFGMLCARFRDLPQIIGALVNITFFVTPVFWYKDTLGARGYIADYNPLFSLLDLVRAPLLGGLPSAHSAVMAIAVTLGGWLLTFLYSRRYQATLAYWV
jgi:ABC-type polysaccharide/polyol phosphate export permease